MTLWGMNLEGVLIGLGAFLTIGIFHPIVIKCEYYFSVRCWPWFLAAGCSFAALSFLMDSTLLSALFGVIAFSCFWSILELKEQRERVRKGWFPANPKRAGQENGEDGVGGERIESISAEKKEATEGGDQEAADDRREDFGGDKTAVQSAKDETPS